LRALALAAALAAAAPAAADDLAGPIVALLTRTHTLPDGRPVREEYARLEGCLLTVVHDRAAAGLCRGPHDRNPARIEMHRDLRALSGPPRLEPSRGASRHFDKVAVIFPVRGDIAAELDAQSARFNELWTEALGGRPPGLVKPLQNPAFRDRIAAELDQPLLARMGNTRVACSGESWLQPRDANGHSLFVVPPDRAAAFAAALGAYAAEFCPAPP
jgi:hypothetical protein